MASKTVLQQAGVNGHGLAMGLGLDRILMLRKSIRDIRLLRSSDERVQSQMLDLGPYVPVSNQPATKRDLSLAVDESLTAEEIGDILREHLPEQVTRIEEIRVLSETPYDELPSEAHQRMGMSDGQKNLLLRLVIRDPVATLRSCDANEVRDLVYKLLHRGSRLELS